MSQQRCPSVERLQGLIKELREEDGGAEVPYLNNQVDIIDALTWLKDHLLNRRNYHRKVQVKRKIMTKMIAEQGLAEQLDAYISEQYGEHLERFDDNMEDTDD